MSPWEFGPFEPGFNHEFELPESYRIDYDLLKGADMGWISQLDEETPAMPMSPEVMRPNLGTPSTISPSSPGAPLLPNEAISPSPLAPPNEMVCVTIDQSHNLAPQKHEPGVYHLVVVMEAIESSQSSHNPFNTQTDTQATFVSFGPSNDKRLEILYMKQLLLVKKFDRVG